jgi:hypothetical protein
MRALQIKKLLKSLDFICLFIRFHYGPWPGSTEYKFNMIYGAKM